MSSVVYDVLLCRLLLCGKSLLVDFWITNSFLQNLSRYLILIEANEKRI